MNEQNYASLEASKRLVDAGIIIITDTCFKPYIGPAVMGRCRFGCPRRDDESTLVCYPAPSMAEMWRVMPHGCYIKQDGEGFVVGMDDGKLCVHARHDAGANPTDALIDLYIWTLQRKEKSC